ncbi:sensor histidine kinase [Lampropedia puyangensis]|uniref:histidine kinase n=1 Tax=Lampropedia puyangensis TaxID=1330072 RepID=A0A4S8F109_9BURK|nr:sensor histidine kinase [Lampropedia puyangensis]THT99954.1 sensor histidine kinase [Lampropedia puyangensis]
MSSTHSSQTLIKRSGALMRSPSLLMAIASLILLGILGVNEVAFRGANSALDNSIAYQEENAAANAVVQSVLQTQALLKGYVASHDTSVRQQYQASRQQVLAQLAHLESILGHDGLALPEFAMLKKEVQDNLHELEIMQDLHDAGETDALAIALSSYPSDNSISSIQSVEARYQAAQKAQIANTHQKTAFFLRLSQLGVALVSLAALLVFFLYLKKVKADRAQQLQRQQQLEAEQMRLESIVRQRTASLFALASHLQNVRDEERAALAHELHDELGSLLTVAKLDVANTKTMIEGKSPDGAKVQGKLEHLQETLGQLVTIKRRIIDRLFPSALDTLGLTQALELLAQQFSNASGLQVQTQLDEVALPEKLALMVYRVTQEALNNISKYAQASRVNISLAVAASDGAMTLQIQDDGKGFDPAAISATNYGIRGMKHRVESLGGQWAIDSGPSGTRISVELPPDTQQQRV